MADVLADKYRSLFVIGRGGMGAVEAAVESGRDRVVALKRLLPEAARDARRAEMFLREAKVARLLEHPNVVRAFDYGEVDGELYLAMEYVEGQSLAVVLRALDAPLPPAVTAHLLAEVCEGLHAAHELHGEDGEALQLVHRDVSPQNIMVGYDGRVRLLDFGVAKIEAESVTKTGEVKGKTAYMSPEQAMGDEIDRRSDLFGVGAVLFECMTLKRMWGAGTDMDVIRKLALEEPPELEAPAPMRALYKRLVARDAKGRPATALAVAEELRTMADADGAKFLADLLTETFGDQLAAQRKQLELALEDASPALRKSVIPQIGHRVSQMTTLPAPSQIGTKAKRQQWLVVAAVAVAVSVLVWIAFRKPAAAEAPPPVPVVEEAKKEPEIEPRPVITASAPTVAMPTLDEPKVVRPALPAHPVQSARILAQPVPVPVPVLVPPKASATPPKIDDKPF